MEGKPKETGKPAKKRCLVCNKKVGALGFTCRCNGLFCGEHRSDLAHDCSFNYAELGNELLADRLVVVGGNKLGN